MGLPWPAAAAAAPFCCCVWLGRAEVEAEWCGGGWWPCWRAARMRARSSSRITPEYLSSSSNCTTWHSTAHSTAHDTAEDKKNVERYRQ